MTAGELEDRAGRIRPGEELPLAPLRDHLRPLLGAAADTLEVRQFPGGHSNLTYLLGSGDEQWVLRRPPFGSKVKSAHDMSREYRILSALKDVFPYGPVPAHFCDDHAVIGCDFYLMNYIRGLVIRREYPLGLRLTPAQTRQQLFNFFDVLGDLHSVNLAEAGLEDFGRPAGFAQRQVEGWIRRWENAVTGDTVNCDAIIKWLGDHLPPESGRASVIHNDYKLDNVIFSLDDPLRLIGVLDWEMATVGDPVMDLAYTLGYWVQTSDPDWYRAARPEPRRNPQPLSATHRNRGRQFPLLFLFRPVPPAGDRPADLLPLPPRPHPRRTLRGIPEKGLRAAENVRNDRQR